MKTIIIKNDQAKIYTCNLVEELPADGTMTVQIKKTDKSSTGRQQRLRFLWFSEVAASGLGKSDTKQGVELDAKWIFARPIWIRDDEDFGKIYNFFMKTIDEYRFTDPDLHAASCKKFTANWISIQRMSRWQHAEFLTDFQRYWQDKGVELTLPEMQGVDLKTS